MRITDGNRNSIEAVYLALSDSEAVELIGALEQLQNAEQGWHMHINDEAYEREVTVYREDDETAVF